MLKLISLDEEGFSSGASPIQYASKALWNGLISISIIIRLVVVSMSDEHASRVLLACLYDTISLPITNELLHGLFSASGRVRKVLIF